MYINLIINEHLISNKSMRLSCLKKLIHADFFRRATLALKVGQTDLFLLCNQSEFITH